MLLHHELLTAPGASPTKAVVFLHGILGSGANLRSHARRFIQARPEFLAALIDLRAHGESRGAAANADTVAHAAGDVAETARPWSVPLRAVVGHSFGGKVALALAALHPELESVVTLDSAPGPRSDARGSESTLQVLVMLELLRGPWRDRDAFVAEVESHGVARALGQWLAMNLELRPEGYVFKLSLPRVHALIEDYLQVDLWPVLEQAARAKAGPRFHLVIGASSGVYSVDERERARALEAESGGQVTVDLLNAGHWVHVDDPQGLSEVLLRRL